MIFVTVGNAKQPFKRLLDEIEELVRTGRLDGESVCIQRGNNAPRAVAVRVDEPFFSPEAFQQFVDDADVVVCHGGAGSLSHVFKAGKVPVVMPRRRMYGEALDDQLKLVEQVAALGKIIPAFEPNQLADAINTARETKSRSTQQPQETARMIHLVAAAIEDLSTR